MSARLFPITLAALAATLTGCLTQEQTFHLNPDGSGKLEVNMSVDTAMMAGLGGGGAGQDMGKEVALQLLRGTQGVDTWADLSHETGADGKTKVHGLVYFKDINKLQMNAGEQAGGASAGTLSSKREGDSWIVSTGLPGGETPAQPSAPSSAKPSDDQIKAAIQQAKAQWEASKSLVAPMIEGAKVSTTVKAGGTIKDSVGFTKSDDNTAVLSFGGAQVISAIDGMMNDPKIMEEALTGGDAMGVLRDQKRLQKSIMESLTGGKGLPKIELKPGEPAFDYAAEVAKAKAGQTDAFKALLADSAKPKGGAVIRPPGGSKKPSAPAPAPK